MCGILIYKDKGNDEYIQYRGKFLNRTEINGLTFFHSLLPITGEFTRQPFVKKDIVCEYNGEIYNHDFKRSDGENLIPLYKTFGINFPRHLDGEFAIALYDFGNDLALFITDPFATKPLWRNGIECASYESGVGGHRIEPNTIEGVKISTGEDLFKENYHQWSWVQYKNTYDDWTEKFKEAVKKRATRDCFIGLSSGYDSGAIADALNRRRVNYKAYIVENNENREVLDKRKEFCNHEIVNVKPSIKEILKKRVERVPYIFSSEKEVIDDVASLGLASICQLAQKEGRKVILSGQGADEIIGDYKLYPNQSNFGGVFPEELSEWENFNGGFQRDYLNKEEYIGGAFSIETRYPFLDKDLVQEFLWLKPELKNRNYKAPIFEYLTKNNVPFDKDAKRGFNPFRK
jgi:asparagine synthase (glutamine-hydrolysing)